MILLHSEDDIRVLPVTGVQTFFFLQEEDGIRDLTVTGVQTCALPISGPPRGTPSPCRRGPARARRRSGPRARRAERQAGRASDAAKLLLGPALVYRMGPTLVIERPAMPRRAPVSASSLPSPGRGLRTPSISRVFAAALLAIAVAGLVDRWATWQSARRTQGDMVDLTHRLERVAQLYPSPGIETQIDDLRELAAEVGDDAIQAAIATTILFAVMLVALGVGRWYNRRRLAQPFAHVVGALERVAAGHYEERLDEDQPEEFGMIARGVNRMAGALASREPLNGSNARPLAALDPAGRG